MDPYETMQTVLAAAKKAGVHSALAGYRRTQKRMVRFSNNSITITNYWVSETPTVYLVSDKRRAACIVEEQDSEALRRTVEELASTMRLTPRGDVDFRPPTGPFEYRPVPGTFDSQVAQAETELIDAVEAGVNAARKEGAVRVSGVVIAETQERYVLTSEKAEGSDKTTEIGMTIRAFASDEASGQGITLSTSMNDFHPETAGESAGRIANSAVNPQPCEPGKYAVVFGPSIFANLLNRVGDSASAYTVDLGFSFFTDRLKGSVASDALTLTDNGRLANGPGSTPIDDEGYPTQENCLIRGGILETFLHTSYTAAKQRANLTGNASFEAGIGGMAPSPHNLILRRGDDTFENLLDRAHDGIYVTNNWYTRFQNYRTGDFSTIIRDGAFRIVDGKLAQPLKGLRVSDNMIRILQATKSVSNEQQWIKWWEVQTPTLTPHALVENVGITTANK